MPTRWSNPLKPVLPRAKPWKLSYAALKHRTFAEQDGKCLICGRSGPKELNHVFLRHSDLPGDLWDRNLGDRIENVVMLHNSCHLEKGHSSDILFAHFKLGKGHNLQAYFHEIQERLPWWSTPAYEILR